MIPVEPSASETSFILSMKTLMLGFDEFLRLLSSFLTWIFLAFVEVEHNLSRYSQTFLDAFKIWPIMELFMCWDRMNITLVSVPSHSLVVLSFDPQ